MSVFVEILPCLHLSKELLKMFLFLMILITLLNSLKLPNFLFYPYFTYKLLPPLSSSCTNSKLGWIILSTVGYHVIISFDRSSLLITCKWIDVAFLVLILDCYPELHFRNSHVPQYDGLKTEWVE